MFEESSSVFFWVVKRVFTLSASFTGWIPGLISDDTILYLSFYKVKHFVNLDESYFWTFANLSPA